MGEPPPSPNGQLAQEERRLGSLGAQHLASILNNPLEVNDTTWDPWSIAGQLGGALGVALGLYADDSPDAAPPLPPGTLREVSMEDFEGYLRRVQGTYPRFVASREAAIAQQTSRTANPTTGADSFSLFSARGARLASIRLLQPGTYSSLNSDPHSPAALTGERQQVATATGAPTQGVALAQVCTLPRDTSRLPFYAHPRVHGRNLSPAVLYYRSRAQLSLRVTPRTARFESPLYIFPTSPRRQCSRCP